MATTLKTLTLEQYANKVGYKGFSNDTTLFDIQEFCQEELDLTLWDYPIEELDYVLNEVKSEFVYVIVDGFIRICEY